jgi:thiamine biosynthesis lipoprotein
MNRRDFLHPRQLAQAAGPLVGAVDALQGLEPDAGPPAEAVHQHFARRAMATTFEVILPFGTPLAHVLANEALDEIDRLEEQLTVYREHSEVSRLNARAARHPVAVEQHLFDLLALARRLHDETDGAFDIAVGALIKAWGFYRRQGRVPAPAELDAVRGRIGMRHVRLDAERQTVAFDRAGLEINLGSIGKGYALDRVAARLRGEWGVPNLLVHGGHSSIFAAGREADGAAGWSVGLLDPLQPQRRRAVLRLRDRGLGTSSATYQHLEYQGRRLGHLLDPRTCWPAEGLLSATVTAPTAAEADALATAFFILGVEPARAYCEARPEIGAVLIPAAAPGRLVVLGRAAQELAPLAA